MNIKRRLDRVRKGERSKNSKTWRTIMKSGRLSTLIIDKKSNNINKLITLEKYSRR